MKKSISSIAFLFFISLSLFAAPNPKGMIIRDTDTLHVTFIIPVTGPNYPNLQDSVRYLDALDNECYLSPEDAKEYCFEHKGKLIRMVSCVNTLSLDPSRPLQIFLHLVLDGPLKLFKHYTRGTSGAPGSATQGGAPAMYGSGQSNTYLLKMNVEDMVYYDDMNFKKDIPVFFEKCTTLVKMIEDKIYLKRDIEEIVNYYNTKCGSN